MPDYSALLSHLESQTALSSDEREGIRALPIVRRRMTANSDIVADGEEPSQSCFIISGYACRNKVVPNGGRQILSFHIPGDMPDLQSLYLGRMDHNLTTMSEAVVAYVLHAEIHALLDRLPQLARVFWRDTLVDAAIFRAWIANVGLRQTSDRLAHLFCEQAMRMKAVKLGDETGFPMFFSQSHLAEATGASLVHISRSMQALRRQGLIETSDRRMQILDWAGLVRTANFDPIYLHSQVASA